MGKYKDLRGKGGDSSAVRGIGRPATAEGEGVDRTEAAIVTGFGVVEGGSLSYPRFINEDGAGDETGANTNATASRPAGVQEGDVLIAGLAYNSILGSGPTPPIGWAKLTDSPIGLDLDYQGEVWYKVATASEPETYTWSGRPYWNLIIAAYRNIILPPIGAALGVYRDAAAPAEIAAFGTWLGQQPTVAHDFFADATWADIEAPDFWLNAWQGQSYSMVFSVSMIPASGGDLATGATGAYDSHFTALANDLVAHGLGNATIRPGYEFNGNWFLWAAAGNPTGYASYFRHIVTAMRAVAPDLKFCWCPTIGGDEAFLASCYPGDTYVDYIGMDVYDQSWIVDYTNPVARWADYLTQPGGLNWLASFAASHNKAIALPEWGLAIRGDGHGGGDNTIFVQRMHDWIANHNVAFHCYFEHDEIGDTHRLTGATLLPLGAATYRQLFVISESPPTFADHFDTNTDHALATGSVTPGANYNMLVGVWLFQAALDQAVSATEDDNSTAMSVRAKRIQTHTSTAIADRVQTAVAPTTATLNIAQVPSADNSVNSYDVLVSLPSRKSTLLVDRAIVTGIGTPSGTDDRTTEDSATVVGIGVPSDTDDLTETATVTGIGVPSAVEEYIPSGPPTGIIDDIGGLAPGDEFILRVYPNGPTWFLGGEFSAKLVYGTPSSGSPGDGIGWNDFVTSATTWDYNGTDRLQADGTFYDHATGFQDENNRMGIIADSTVDDEDETAGIAGAAFHLDTALVAPITGLVDGDIFYGALYCSCFFHDTTFGDYTVLATGMKAVRRFVHGTAGGGTVPRFHYDYDGASTVKFCVELSKSFSDGIRYDCGDPNSTVHFDASPGAMGSIYGYTLGGACPSGMLFWRGDLETNDLSQFAGVHTGMPTWGISSATVVQAGSTVSGLHGGDGPWTAPAPRIGTYAVALLVDGPASSVGSAGGQRAELNSGDFAVVGDERWYGLSVYIPTVPNVSGGGLTMYNNAIWEIGFGTALSLKTSEEGSSTGDSNSFQIANAAATDAQKNGWSSAYYHIAPVLYDQWVDFTIHVFWATDDSGFFEVYMNGVLVTMTGLSVPAFSSTRENGPNYGVMADMVSEFDWYRGASDLPNLLYLDEMKIGDTFAIVQPG